MGKLFFFIRQRKAATTTKRGAVAQRWLGEREQDPSYEAFGIIFTSQHDEEEPLGQGGGLITLNAAALLSHFITDMQVKQTSTWTGPLVVLLVKIMLFV